MSISASRVAIVTAALLGIGAMCGAVLGGLGLVAQVRPGLPPAIGATLRLSTRLRFEALVLFSVFRAGAAGGALLGAVLAEMIGWIFLRRVPLGRAIGETALGTLLGIAVSPIALPGFAVPLALAGFLAAAIRLWIVARHRRAREHSFATG